ncbi:MULTISPECIES: SDR family NAD(P)-dependent oxidoreductase [Burkholderia]|uniref:SDR family NAD(P)-dependent oxidoreductase n=1 Tax=Burkholderia TaxID=32008 RepID=UPI001F11A8A4|nr:MULTISPECIES: SDR family NAD(P)-dependent oxidoreductase [Burkholderia]
MLCSTTEIRRLREDEKLFELPKNEGCRTTRLSEQLFNRMRRIVFPVLICIQCKRVEPEIDGERRAVVTGGASGIGLGIARACINAGYRVTIVGRNDQRLREAVAKLGSAATCQLADAGQRTDVESTLTNVGRGDLLVNAAGFVRSVSLGTALDQAELDWNAVIEINLKGSFF